jgi:hypothetical protein
MNDYFELEGLWGHLASKAPSVEVPELANLIGHQLLEENSRKWRELKAFSSILSEMHTLEFDRPLTSDHHDASQRARERDTEEAVTTLSLTQANLNAKVEESKNAEGMPKLELGGDWNVNNCSSAINGNNEEYNEPLTRRSRTSMDSFDFIISIEDCISVSRIGEVIDKLRQAFREEKDELEAEISILYAAMDNESDVIAATAARKAMEKRRSDGASKASIVSNRNPKIERFSPEGKASRWGEGKAATDDYGDYGDNGDYAGEESCEDCLIRRQAAVSHEPGRIRPAKKGRDLLLCPNCEEERERRRQGGGAKGGGGGSEKSKVRNKLQAARDEKHFLDDDLF